MARMLFDETRALRREQREARIERKRERREARAVKREHHPIALETLGLETPVAPEPRTDEPAVDAVAPEAPTAPVVDCAPPPQPTAPDPIRKAAAPTVRPPRSAEREARRTSRRKRDVAEFLERRDDKLSLAREEAKERIARLGEEEAVHDALMALAHPEASPWQQHRERLCEAIDSRRIPDIGAAARRACRGAAADAARTSRRAPDPDTALAVTIAYAIIARAPRATIRSQRAERSAPTRKVHRPFWR